MDGFIYLHRQLLDSTVFANPNHLKIWLWILLKANYSARSVPIKVGSGTKTVDVARGQFIFGRHRAEEELCLSGSMIYRTLQKFDEWGMILMDVNNQYTVITVCKYNDYQNNNIQSEQPMNSQRTTFELDMNQIRTTSELHLNTTNKDNKDNNDNKSENARASFPTIEQCRQIADMSGHNPSFGEAYFYMRDATDWLIPRGNSGQLYPINNWRSDYTNCYNRGYLEPKNKNNEHEYKVVDGGVFQ